MVTHRNTRQKQAIADILKTFEDFRSAQQIHHELAQLGSGIGLATVYRNLQAMADSGQLDTIRSEDGEALYRLCGNHDHHHHMVCRKCGYSIDVNALEFENWVDKLAAEHGFTAVEHSADIFGLCTDCSK